MSFKLPKQGFVFWPVGTGDSTTIVVDPTVNVQVDLHHLGCSENDDDGRMPVIDHLEEVLPQLDGRPYLSVFCLTHPDKDHCLGFADLLQRVAIGEIWFSPRVFREYHRELCDDASAFKKEAQRRVREAIRLDGSTGPGDRVRVIGYDELLNDEKYRGLPKSRLSVPGHTITEIDGEDCSDRFRAFIHGPFKDHADGERNDTSIAMQVTLCGDGAEGRAMLLGDHCYPTVQRIFAYSAANDVRWNVFLSPHHCSKSVMHWQGEGESEMKLKQDILDAIEAAAESPGYVVASCDPVPSQNQSGDNPPHANAKRRYEEIAPDGFLCTQEHPSEEAPEPIVFEMGADGLEYREPKKTAKSVASTLSQAAATARGTQDPPTRKVGFGEL